MFHQQFYPNQRYQHNFPNNHGSTNFFTPPYPYYYRSNGPIFNQSAHNLNFTHDFERFYTPQNGYPFYDVTNQNFEQHRWRQNQTRPQQQYRRMPAFHFQDKSTSYYVTDPIVTNDDRLTIQLTKVHIGPNGDQQRVFVEQEFSNENELNTFIRNLRRNFEKTIHNQSSGGSSNTDENNSTDGKKPGVVVVEEPDEEPKIYQQQAYNAKIASKKAAKSTITPPRSPTIKSAHQSSNDERHRTKYISPSTSQISSTSTTHTYRRHKNKMKYRRQQPDNREELRSSRIFQMPSFSRRHPATPPPSRFQQRFFTTDNDFHIKNQFNGPLNTNFQWRNHHNGFTKTRSRSYVPPMNDNFSSAAPPPPPTPSHFQNPTDPFFRPIPSQRFAHHRQKDFRSSSSPSKFHRTQRQKSNQPITVTDNIVYPTTEHQQPRVHRTKSECQNFQKQSKHHKSQSTTNHFQKFSPLQQPPIIQRHFIPFCSPPVFSSSVHTTTPRFYSKQRRQFGSMQPQSRLINHFRLGTNRF